MGSNSDPIKNKMEFNHKIYRKIEKENRMEHNMEYDEIEAQTKG